MTSLPKDIEKIKVSTKDELQQYRDDLVREREALNFAQDVVAPVSGWAKKTLSELDEAHPLEDDDSKAYKDMRQYLKCLRDFDSGASLSSGINSFKKLIENVNAFENENVGEQKDNTLAGFAQKMKSFAESKLPILEELKPKTNTGTFIADGISKKTETIRRIDKEAELRGIELDKNPGMNKEDALSRAQFTDKRIEAAGRMLEDAKKGVWGGSKEYDTAAKSFAEMSKAYKSFREMGDNASDEQRMNAIEAYQEAANKARLDMDKYLKYCEAKGPLENNKDAKTQKRIDSINAAIDVVRETNVFMDSCYADVSKKVLRAENAKMYTEEKEKITRFRMDMDKDPSYMKHSVKGASDAMDKLEELSSGNNKAPLSEKELDDAKRAMAALTIYTTITHGRKNDKGFEIPITEDLLAPMIDKMMNQPAFQKVTADINTREQIRNVMVNPDELRKRYTIEAVAEKQVQKQNAERQPVRREQPVQEMNNQKQNGQPVNQNDQHNRQKGGMNGPNN